MYMHVRTLTALANHARIIITVLYCVWPHPHPYTNVLSEGDVVVLHVYKHVVVFIVVPYHTCIQSFSSSYVDKYAPIIMYGLGLFFVVLT